MQTIIKILGFLRKPARHKGRIGWTYLKLIALKRFGGDRRSATVFGYRMHFRDMATFVFLYEEIFLGQHYRLHSDQDAPNIIDAGANIGLTVIYFKTLYPRSTILCFEPDPENFRFLTQNVKENRLSDVTIRQAALSDRPGALTLYGDNISASIDAHAPEGAKGVDVPADTLSKYLAHPVDLLKMDIEGAEGTVLKEAAARLPQIRRIALEFHQFHDTARLPDLLRIFEQSGHRYDISHWTRNPADPAIFYCLVHTEHIQ